MIIFDVKTASGRVVSTIMVGESESSFVGQRYDDNYLSSFRDQYNEEVAIVSRVEIDKHPIANRKFIGD